MTRNQFDSLLSSDRGAVPQTRISNSLVHRLPVEAKSEGATVVNPGPEPGWYLDPEGSDGKTRYWNGTEWTEHRKATPEPTDHTTPTAVRIVTPKWLKVTFLIVALAAVVIFVVIAEQKSNQFVHNTQDTVMKTCMDRERDEGIDSDAVMIEKCHKEAGIK
jgi:hypothetical protein